MHIFIKNICLGILLLAFCPIALCEQNIEDTLDYFPPVLNLHQQSEDGISKKYEAILKIKKWKLPKRRHGWFLKWKKERKLNCESINIFMELKACLKMN